MFTIRVGLEPGEEGRWGVRPREYMVRPAGVPVRLLPGALDGALGVRGSPASNEGYTAHRQ